MGLSGRLFQTQNLHIPDLGRCCCWWWLIGPLFRSISRKPPSPRPNNRGTLVDYRWGVGEWTSSRERAECWKQQQSTTDNNMKKTHKKQQKQKETTTNQPTIIAWVWMNWSPRDGELNPWGASWSRLLEEQQQQWITDSNIKSKNKNNNKNNQPKLKHETESWTPEGGV